MAIRKTSDFQNDVTFTGYVFSMNFRTGVSRTTSKWHPNEAYISGNLHVATDDNATNVVPINFFVYEKRNNRDGGAVPNETYQTLKQLMDMPTFETAGTSAPKVRISGSVDTNDFYSTRTSSMVSAQRVSGRFVHIATPGLNVTPAGFDVNTIVTSTVEREEEGRDPFLDVRGYVFNYNGSRIFPVRFECRDQGGIDFLLGLDASSSNPVAVNLWGEIQTTLIVKQNEAEEAAVSGFGVRPTISGNQVSTLRSWVITGADTSGLSEFGTTDVFSSVGLKKLIDERNVRLEQLKQSGIERASGGAGFQTAKPAAKPRAAAKTSAEIYDDDLPF